MIRIEKNNPPPDHEDMENKKENNEQIIAKEYRLIPLDAPDYSRQWSFKDLVFEFWEYKKFIYWIIGISVFFGILVAISKPETYDVTSTLLIESQNNNQVGSLLRSYGGLLGLGSDMISPTGDIDATLYPTIISSTPFELELMNQKLHFANYDTTTSIYDFFTQIYKPNFYYWLKRYTIGLDGLEKQFFKKKRPDGINSASPDSNVLVVSPKRLAVARGMGDLITISPGEYSETVIIEGIMPDPTAAAGLVNATRRLLSKYVIDKRTQKAQAYLTFIQSQFNNSEVQFQAAQDTLAKFIDQNNNLATAKAQTEEQLLQSNYTLAENLYNNMAQQLQQAQIEVQKDTPVFSTIEPVIVPSSYTYPNRILILILSLFLGFFTSVLIIGGVIVGKKIYKNMTQA